jgi:hypothetical protein
VKVVKMLIDNLHNSLSDRRRTVEFAEFFGFVLGSFYCAGFAKAAGCVCIRHYPSEKGWGRNAVLVAAA